MLMRKLVQTKRKGPSDLKWWSEPYCERWGGRRRVW